MFIFAALFKGKQASKQTDNEKYDSFSDNNHIYIYIFLQNNLN